MGFFAILTVAVIAAAIIAVLFTMNSNYLDPNINTSLDLTERLKLRGTFTAEDKKENNTILRNKLNTIEKALIIFEEMDRHNKSRSVVNAPSTAPVSKSSQQRGASE